MTAIRSFNDAYASFRGHICGVSVGTRWPPVQMVAANMCSSSRIPCMGRRLAFLENRDEPKAPATFDSFAVGREGSRYRVIAFTASSVVHTPLAIIP
jgi:hypothetical protein